jgi:hypothetical protein
VKTALVRSLHRRSTTQLLLFFLNNLSFHLYSTVSM